jgi:regulatory protein
MPTSAATAKPNATRPPDASSLRQAALAHLARFAATEAGLARVLGRKIDNWARKSTEEPDAVLAATQSARACIPAIVRQLVEAGAISDAAFAQTRARSLSRAGRSRRAIGAHLATRGVPAALAAEALPNDPAHEFVAALIHARKRRLGPWRKHATSPELLRRELGSLARAGFGHDVASKALDSDQSEAEAIINKFRQDVLF